jgi:TonB family protein
VQLDPGRRATLKEISGLLNPGSAAAHREIPMALPMAGAAAAEPEKKSLASQHVSLAPHTLLGATPARATASTSLPRKPRIALPVLLAVVVMAAILLAPRVLNRFSQLQPHADTVQPSIAPAPETLTPPPAKSTAIKPEASKGGDSQTRGEQAGKVETPSAKRTEAPKETSSADPNRDAAIAKPPVAAKVGNTSKMAASSAGHGAVQYQVVPEISARAKDTIQGTVRVFVKLHVDASGNVSNAELTNGSNRFFGEQAVNVSRRWTFTPPQVNGQNAASEWLLRYEFSRGTTKVFPTQTNP